MIILNAGKNAEKLDQSYIAVENVKLIATLENSLGNFIKKQKQLNMQLSHDPAVALLGIYPREMKTYIYTKTCTQMFIETLFIIVPN